MFYVVNDRIGEKKENALSKTSLENWRTQTNDDRFFILIMMMKQKEEPLSPLDRDQKDQEALK